MTQAPDNEQYWEPDTIVHMPFAGALAGAGGKGAGGGGDGEGGGGCPRGGGIGEGGGGDICGACVQPLAMIW